MNTHDTVDPAWPTQLRLPGQTAAHPGPVDMTMMYVMHHAFRRDLAALAAAAEATPVTDRETWRALGTRWELFGFALHHHHSGEDAGLWPMMSERATDEERIVLDAMEAEHAEIDPILEACSAGFARLRVTADEDARPALAVRLVAARERLGHHLHHEETGAIPMIQRLLTNADWQGLEDEYFKPGIPLRRLGALVPWVLEGVPDAVRRDLFARPGGRMHRLLWVLTRRAHRRGAEVAFRYAS